jgi:hypothetical protein
VITIKDYSKLEDRINLLYECIKKEALSISIGGEANTEIKKSREVFKRAFEEARIFN